MEFENNFLCLAKSLWQIIQTMRSFRKAAQSRSKWKHLFGGIWKPQKHLGFERPVSPREGKHVDVGPAPLQLFPFSTAANLQLFKWRHKTSSEECPAPGDREAQRSGNVSWAVIGTEVLASLQCRQHWVASGWLRGMATWIEPSASRRSEEVKLSSVAVGIEGPGEELQLSDLEPEVKQNSQRDTRARVGPELTYSTVSWVDFEWHSCVFPCIYRHKPSLFWGQHLEALHCWYA